jgi:hypothetical protein
VELTQFSQNPSSFYPQATSDTSIYKIFAAPNTHHFSIQNDYFKSICGNARDILLPLSEEHNILMVAHVFEAYLSVFVLLLHCQQWLNNI